MKQLDLENKCLIFGNTSLIKTSLKGLTKEEYMKTFPKIFGPQAVDLKEAWKIIKPFTIVEKPKPTKKK